MAKLISGKTRITIENAASKPMVFETGSVSISSNNGGEHHHIAVAPARQVSLSCAKVEGYSKEPTPTAHEQKVAQYSQSIVDALRKAENNQIQAVTERERLETEIAQRERTDRVALRFAVHAAIQAGVLDSEELTTNMRDDYAGYVSDMYEQVYVHTDLDTVVNGS